MKKLILESRFLRRYDHQMRQTDTGGYVAISDLIIALARKGYDLTLDGEMCPLLRHPVGVARMVRMSGVSTADGVTVSASTAARPAAPPCGDGERREE